MHLTSLKTRDLASRVVAALAVLALLWAPVEADARGAAQEEPQEPIEALGRALGMTPAEVEALGLSPEEVQNLLAGFTDETVVVGSRAQPRTVTASPVPVDVLSTADLTRQGTLNLPDQLRTVVPSFNVNTQPISDASTVVRPAMLRNLAPDHTLVLVNGKRRHRSSIHRLARRQRRGVRIAGPRHLGHPGYRATAGRSPAGRGGRAVRLGRDRWRAELPAQGCSFRRRPRVQHRHVRRWRRRGDACRRQRRPAARRHRLRQPQPRVRRLEPDEPERAPQRRDRAHRGREHGRAVRYAAGLGDRRTSRTT